MNSFGRTVDGTVNHDLIIEIFDANTDETSFTLIEDDGETIAYQEGAVQEITISYVHEGEGWTIEIAAANGSYDGAATHRTIDLHLIQPDDTSVIASVQYDVTAAQRISNP